jgi:ABC-2 type transport system ATP-binding protein
LTLEPRTSDGSSASARREPLIVVKGVEKAFGSLVALAGVDLVVERGTVLALLGRNGAGKTTLVRVLSTLLRPDAGRASIAGLDVVRSAQRVRSLIGLAGQSAAVDPTLTGRENLELVARLYGLGRHEARARAEEALERLSLTAAGDRRVFTYSGGMRRRLDLGASLVGKPLVLIMDEPTTGLDPRTRIDLWKFVDELVREGTTVLLTTQYLEEADRLADQIAVLERGHVIATGTAAELKQRIGGDVLELRARNAVELERLRGLLTGLGASEPTTDLRWQRITLPTNDPINTLLAAAQRIQEAGIEVEDLGLRHPSLDDVFLTLTDGDEEHGAPAPRAAQQPEKDADGGVAGA